MRHSRQMPKIERKWEEFKWREVKEMERIEEMEREEISLWLHFPPLSPFHLSISISPLSPFPHTPSISSPFPHSLPISSFSLHFLSISSFSLHFLILHFLIHSNHWLCWCLNKDILFLMCCSLLAASIYGLSRECRENLNIRCMRKWFWIKQAARKPRNSCSPDSRYRINIKEDKPTQHCQRKQEKIIWFLLIFTTLTQPAESLLLYSQAGKRKMWRNLSWWALQHILACNAWKQRLQWPEWPEFIFSQASQAVLV